MTIVLYIVAHLVLYFYWNPGNKDHNTPHHLHKFDCFQKRFFLNID